MSIEDEQARFQAEGRPGEIFGEYLMRTADRREAEFQARRCADYAKDNARLRALIQKAEWAQTGSHEYGDWRACPWCDSEGDHTADCPAFVKSLLTGKTLVR